MFCYNCGKELPENAVFCPFCGTQVGVAINTEINENQENQPLEEGEPPVVEETVVQEPEPVDEAPLEDTDTESGRETAPHAISSFVWSLVANESSIIPVLGLIFSLIAFVKSLKGRKIVKVDPERYKLKGFLTASLIISIFALVGSILGPILLASYFSLIKDIFHGSGPLSSTFV
ncbi:MAG: zinc ribbon domain-containing protein [Bacteroidaceae bacterium]|nr:zinc ribbon domain-containing protein [Bacteroidaceae bacterium]